MMKRRMMFVMLIIVFSIFFLVGWGESKVKLLGDKKLIDLDKAIEYVGPGGEWEKSQSDNNNDTEEQEEQDNPDIEETEEPVKDVPVRIEISVNGEIVSYDNNPVNDYDIIEKLIRRDNKDKTTFILVDDWAEARTYKEAIEFMKQMKQELGINYTTQERTE